MKIRDVRHAVAQGAETASKRLPVRLALFSLLAFLAILPLQNAGLYNEFRDAQLLATYEHNAVRSVLEYGQIPLWNPYSCGGLYALGTPQSRFAAPPFLLSLIFGVEAAQVVCAYLMFVLGMEGAFRWLSRRSHSAVAPLLAAPILALNGLFGAAYFNGWINFFGFLLVPWALFGVSLLGDRKTSGLVIASLAFAFIIGFGGTYAAPMTALFSIVEIARALASARRRTDQLAQILGFAVLGCCFGAAICAFRIWPIAETLHTSARIMAGAPEVPLHDIRAALFNWPAPSGGNLTMAGAFFVGGAALWTAIPGLFSKKALPPLLVCGLCVWMASGYSSPRAPFVLLRELPLYSTLRYPERFLFFACVYAVELIAIGIDALALWARRWPILAWSFIPVMAACAINYQTQIHAFHRAIAGMWTSPPPARVSQEFRQARGNRWILGHFEAQNRGSLSCWEAYPVRQSKKLDGAARSEAWLENANGTVSPSKWSPNRIDLDVNLSAPARLAVNQNWHSGWRASIGTVVSDDGRLGVDLPSGKHHLVLRFLPSSAVGGFAVSIAALVAMLWLVTRQRRGDAIFSRAHAGKTALAALFPATVFGLCWAGLPGPRMPPADLTNANGQPVLATALPSDADPVKVEFTVPAVLEGVRVGSLDEANVLPLELYWRRVGPVPRSLGIFVHIEGTAGRIGADHEVIGTSVFFADVPKNQLSRDAFSVYLPQPSGSWRLLVGLWHPGGDKSRVRVKSSAGLDFRDDRVLVKQFTLP